MIARNILQLKQFTYFLCPFPAFAINDRRARNFFQDFNDLVDLGIYFETLYERFGRSKD
jgi:hypothetical protein